MKYASLIFLGLLAAFALSWLGMVATPQFQLGDQQPTNVPPTNVLYPTPLPGLANLGREVYRANGCAYCHTQVVRQQGTLFAVVITNPGTNPPAVLQALSQLRPGRSNADLEQFLTSRQPVVTEPVKATADTAQKTLSDAGAEAAVRVVPTGPDIERGWGTRLSVAHDYLYETPVMLGVSRIGPDLTNVGVRRPDEVWHLLHLYDPRLEVPGSIMPRYPFLFEKRKRGSKPSSDALPIQGQFEIVPTREARGLAVYLANLRAEIPLFEAPGPQVSGPTSPGGTNTPAGSAPTTNAPAAAPTVTNAPAPASTNTTAAGQAASP